MTRNLVVEALFDIDPVTYDLAPSLAEKWSEADEHHVTTLTLRRGLHFHDGSDFSSKDVMAVLDAVKDPERNTGAARAELEELTGWKALDDFTLELRWRNPSPFNFRALARLPMLSATALAAKDWASLAAKPMGTGPYVIEAWERGKSLTLRRVAEQGAYLDTIVFRFVKDHLVATGLFERGELDVLTNVQPGVWKALEQSPLAIAQYVRLKGIDNSYSYIAWNEAVPALADVRVRRALGHLYPVQAIEKMVDLGLEQPTTCPFWAPSASCDSAVKPIGFSPQLARSELLDAGFGALSLHFLMPATSVRLAKVTPLLQEQFQKAGAELIIETVDISQMAARVNARDFEVVSRVWTELDAVQDQYTTFHSSQIDAGANFVRYSSREADQLMEAIRREWELPKRQALERQLHRRLYEDQPYFFMTSRSSLDLAKRTVHGLKPSPLWYDLRRVWVEAPSKP